MSDTDRTSALRDEAAARLLDTHLSGRPPEDDRSLGAWRGEQAEHEAAFLSVNRTWDAAGELPDHPDYARLLGAPTWRERWVAFRERFAVPIQPVFRPRAMAFASAVIAIGLGSGWLALDRPWAPDYQTKVAEIRQVPLKDGSVVTLGAQSSLDVAFTSDVRRVSLAHGEAFFSVSKNPARPFIVEAGDTVIRVVGTKFNVNNEGGHVRVTVLEGIVEVMHAGGSTERIGAADPRLPKVRITAGQQALDSTAFTAPKIEPTPVVEAGAWRAGRMSYQDATLAEIIADANRYRMGQIRIGSQALADERLTTSFRASQVDQMLDTLPDTLPVEVRRNADGTVDLQPR